MNWIALFYDDVTMMMEIMKVKMIVMVVTKITMIQHFTYMSRCKSSSRNKLPAYLPTFEYLIQNIYLCFNLSIKLE